MNNRTGRNLIGFILGAIPLLAAGLELLGLIDTRMMIIIAVVGIGLSIIFQAYLKYEMYRELSNMEAELDRIEEKVKRS